MPFTIEERTDLPAPTVVVTMQEPFDSARDSLLSTGAANSQVAAIEGDLVYVIVDLSQLKLDLSSLMEGFAAAFLPHEGVSMDHVMASRVRTLMIGTGSLMKMAARAAGQEQYGSRQIELFPTLDKALDFIRQPETA